MGAWYCTLQQVMRALDAPPTARATAQIGRLIEANSRAVDRLCQRPPNAFAPTTATRTFDWPPPQSSASWRLWLDQLPLTSATTITSGGTTIAATDYLLRPDHGPPYTHIEIDISTSSAWSASDTHQRAISIAGIWSAAPVDERTAGALAEALDATETGVDVTAATAATVGAGTILLAGSERMLVTATTAADTTVDTGSALTASLADTSVTIADGTAFAVGETLLIDSERLYIRDTTATTLVVDRAQDGTAVAAHSSGADIYAYRTLTVTRGALGTTAAGHADAATLTYHQPPGPVEQLVIARTTAAIGSEAAGYASDSGGSDSSRRLRSDLLDGLADEVRLLYGRHLRHRAV
jgi:hypothetical protein